MYCICCNKDNVHLLNDKDNSEKLWERKVRGDKTLNVSSEMHDNGVIEVISAGYGSVNDGSQFIIAICDECIKKNVERGTLLYFDSYMYNPDTEDQIKKSKKNL